VDQYNRVQAFVPESFWYIYVAIEKQPEDRDSREMEITEFKWKRNHLFDEQVVTVLYEQCVEEPLATVTSVETKPTTKWYVSLNSETPKC
jgi:DNA topoisomerase-3